MGEIQQPGRVGRPFLRHLAPRSNVKIDPDRVVALRPEERVVPVLERWLKPGVFEQFIDAFLELLVENDYLSRAAAWLATPGLIRSRLKEDDDLWERAGHSALEALEGSRSLPGKPPNLSDPPSGCRFHPRCPLAIERCKTVAPEMLPSDTGGRVACHRAGEADIL